MVCTISEIFQYYNSQQPGLEQDYCMHGKLVHRKTHMCTLIHKPFPIKINIGSPVIKSEYQNFTQGTFLNSKQQNCS